MAEHRYYATGKRKNAVVRVWIKPGSGKVEVNKSSFEDYFGGGDRQVFHDQTLCPDRTR